MKILTFNSGGQGVSGFSWEKGDKLQIDRETKKTVQILNDDGTKNVFSKTLFNEY